MFFMRNANRALLVIFLIYILGNHLVVKALPQITSITTSLSSIVPAYGSFEGGTYLYIKGSGFSSEAAENSVFIGPYPCVLLAEGAKQDRLSCQTTRAYDLSIRRSLSVSIQVSGQKKVTCSSNQCKFSYSDTSTPKIQQIAPRTAIGDQQISIWGAHRITDPGDQRSNGVGQIKNLRIEDIVCSTLDITQQDDINANGRDYIKCKVFKDQEAGQYSFTEHVQPGYASLQVRTLQTSLFTEKNYTQRIAARISSMPYHSGGGMGHEIEIKGTGFSKDASKYQCRIAGQICTVKNTQSTSLTVVVPPLDVANTAFDALAKDAADTQTQQRQYLGSNGFRYTRYTMTSWKTTTQLFTILRGAHSLKVQAEQIRTQLRSPQLINSYFIQYWRGYFYAPVTGEYRFAGIADDAFRVQLSAVQNSANTANLQDLVYSQSYSEDNFNPYYSGDSALIANKTLTQGYYYMQIVNFNWGGTGDFRLLVDMPQIHTYTTNPTWQVQQVIISPAAITPEIIQIKVTKTALGTANQFSISYFETSTLSYSASIPVGANQAVFKREMENLPFYGNYKPTVTLTTKDSSGATTAVPASIETYTYRLTYDRYRNLPVTPFLRQFYSAKATFTRVQNHSKPITGSYKLMVNNVVFNTWSSTNKNFSVPDIPFNTEGWKLQDALNDLYKTDKIRIRIMKDVDFDETIKFVIQYVGIMGAAYPITVNTSTLLGGDTDLFTASVTTKRQFSLTRPLYSPLPFDFMRTAQIKPQLYLKVNQIPVICSGCQYQFDSAKTPQVTTALLSADTLSLSITDPGSVGFDLTDLKITLNNVRCTQITGNLASLTCKFLQNTAGDAAVPAGNNKPIIHVMQVGYAESSTISAINVPLVVTSVTPSVVGINGGVQGTIVGKGFPISKQPGSISLSLCGNIVTQILSVSNELIIFVIPKAVTMCTVNSGTRLLQTVTSQLSVDGQSQTITTFKYDSSLLPVITSLSKTSSSPIVKSTLIITGTSFSTLAKTKVFLVDSSGFRKYELTVVSVATTSIECILGGGRTGTYNVVVLDSSAGQSSTGANTAFNYQIIVDSISPISGSLGGGYDVTITGRNFAQASSHTVFIGQAQNMVCVMKSATLTQIICTVPRIDSTYNAGTPVNIVVTGRLLEQSICKGTCGFTYDSSVTKTVVVPSVIKYSSGDNVTITGTGLTGATVKIGNVDVTPTLSQDTSLSFIYPALKQGSYEVLIKTSTGYTHPKIITTTALWFEPGLSRSSGSLNGHRLSVNANGLPKAADKYLSVNLICANYSSNLNIISVVPNKLTFETIPSLVGQACKVNITYQTTFIIFPYTYKTSETYNSTISQSGSDYIITSTASVDAVSFQYFSSQNSPTTTIYPGTVTKTTATTYLVTPTGGYLPKGKFRILVHTVFFGYHTVTPSTFTKLWSTNPTFTAVTSSIVGGKQVSLSGQGFISQDVQNNQIFVCGLRAKIKSGTNSQLVLQVPALVTKATQNLYKIAKQTNIMGTLISDSPQKALNVIDDKPTTYYSSQNTTCYVGFNFGVNAKANIQYIKYMPNPEWPIAAIKLQGAKFQGSNDNSVWTQIFIIDTMNVHSGWNYWAKAQGSTVQYQYVRFSHTSVSKCQLADIQVSGIIYSTLTIDPVTDKQCDIVIKGSTDVTLPNAVTYSHTKTSTVTGVSPSFGPSVGGTTLTITGTNFAPSSLSVMIDGIACAISANTSNSITCTTGVRSTIPASNSFVIVSDGNPVLLTSTARPFNYIDRWSSQDTWGGESIPREGDSIYVPKGMSLLVDVPSTPVLDSIIVQGRIVFADQIDMTLDAHYFIISGGQFTAGTQINRYQHKLTITLHGGFYDKQLPIFGNKVLGCRNCKFSLHGQERTPTWTQLLSTVSIGATSFQVLVPVDWRAGQRIVVASSSFDHYQAEERTILSVSANKTAITVTQPFKYRHYAAVQTYNGTLFPMRAEVGLLTRNIKVQGDQASVGTEFGSHMMINGKKSSGLVASFSYAEFTRCGQPKIVGRYCTHFHMAGQMPQSSVRGLAVHHSYARVLTIHGTHFLLVEKNVGYHVKGHNIFIQDGVQTNNVIQDNLLISSITSLTLLQSDISVASYWITNPYNTVRRNHAAGSDFYGFWYQIKEHPDGPSASSDICPIGMQLGQSRDNVAHSNVRFGLRIFKLSARKYPCLSTKNQSLIDPYSANPAFESVFDNYTLWRNEECGFLGQELGYTTIKNFKIADSKKAGMQFHKTNFTKQLVVAKDCLIVGHSRGNAPANITKEYAKARGIITARTDGLKASGISFHNFGTTMTPLMSCSQCDNMKLWVVGSKTTEFQKITYQNVTGDYIFWQKWRRQVFMDLDGTLLKPVVTALSLPAQTSGSITPYRASVMVPSHCYQINGTIWDHSTYCDSTVTLRSILFTNAIPHINFNAINIKAHLLTTPYDKFTALKPIEQTFSQEYMIIIKKSLDIKNSWAMPFAVGKYYNVHWKWGIDFTHLAIAPSRLWNSTQGTVLRFNYTDQRELFQIGKWYKSQLQKPFIVEKTAIIDPSTCQNGDYFNDKQARYIFVCVSGRNKAINQWIDVNGIRCRDFCPKEQKDGQRQDAPKLWSNASIWPNSTKPKIGDNVTIPFQWNLILDEPVPKLNYVQVNGLLIFDVNKNHTFEAHYIWVRKGIIRIGTAQKAYTNQAKIVLHGQKDDRYLVLDPDASGNKMLAVTGELQFFGKITNNVWTRLTSIAPVGATSVQVANGTGWEIGDKIVIGPTYTGQTQDQNVQITAINGNNVTFTPALKYEHYGASSPITNNYGVLDTRGGVALLTRNIKITKGTDANGWGCTVLVYSYADIPEDPIQPVITRTGKITFDGVQVDSCGQYDTTYAGVRLQSLGKHQNNSQRPNIITRSAFHSSIGMGMWVANSKNVKIDNNIFYNAKKFLVYAQFVNNYTVTNNLFIGAKKRPQLAGILDATRMADDVACYQQYEPINYVTDNVTVTKNFAQGSQGGQGFVFPFAPCEKLSTYNFGGNTAGSCEIAFMFNKLPGFGCVGASKMVGYASKIGLMANPTLSITKLIYEDVIFTDNERGITLRYANDIDDNSMILRNSYFAGFSRPDCPNCYSASKLSYCRGGYAVRMFTSTITGQTFPLVKKNTGHDVICTRQSFDMKSFFNNVTFENYLYTNPTVPYCTKMSVFNRHDGASDSTGSAYMTNSPCINCQPNAWGYFQRPSTQWKGWFGGCGQMDCTGPNNYIIYDQDGSFTGKISQILANNTWVGNGQKSCTYNPAINGHYCITDEFAVLEYESIAPDFNKRIMWPVQLKYDTGSWVSQTNGWKEWQWDGNQPLNLRLARFVSVIKLHQNYNLTYAGQPPSDTRFQIQKRILPTGNSSDWIIVRIYYPLPNSLQVLVKNTTGADIIVKPFSINNGVGIDLRNHVGVCGANNFHYENGTIQFVVNGKSNCQVRVRMASYMKLSARLSIEVMDFFSNNGPTTFITNICAFLKIDPGRLKIVGVRSGSTVVDSIITTPGSSLQSSTTTPRNSSSEQADLTTLAATLLAGINSGSVGLGAQVLAVSTNVVIINNDGSVFQHPSQEKSQENKLIMTIVLATVIPSVVILIGIATYCYFKRKRERTVVVNNQSQFYLSNQSDKKYQTKRETIKVSEIPFEISKQSN